MAISLRPINAATWRQCVRLKVAPHQEHFVASNANSLVQAAYEPGHVPLAIYHDETMVGFLMYRHLPDETIYHIYRLMIDAEHQGRGYGRAALRALIDRLSACEDCHAIDISYEPDNQVAQALYASVGFCETGEVDEGELVALLSLR